MMHDQVALALCKRHGGGLTRAGVLDTLDGGWLLVGLGSPALPGTETSKDWRFDPSQPRDEDGRWTVAGGGASQSTSSLQLRPESSQTLTTSGEITVTTDYADQMRGPGDGIVRANIIKYALQNVGSEDWSDLSPPQGSDKCNLFVAYILTKAGADPGSPNHGFFGTPYPPSAGQWADPNFDIPGWHVLGPRDNPMSGDVVAQAIQYTHATGHVGVVGPGGNFIGTGPDGTIENIPMPVKLGPKPIGPLIYRRWTSKE